MIICILHIIDVFTYSNPNSYYFMFAVEFIKPLPIDHLIWLSQHCFEIGKASIIFIVRMLRMKKPRLRKPQQCAQNHEGPSTWNSCLLIPKASLRWSLYHSASRLFPGTVSAMRKSNTHLSPAPCHSSPDKCVSCLIGSTLTGTALPESLATLSGPEAQGHWCYFVMLLSYLSGGACSHLWKERF